MKIDKKVIILVMCSSNPDYKKLENNIKETWFNIKNDDVEIIFYSDNEKIENKSEYPVLIGNDLILPCDDGFFNLGHKTIKAFDWVNKNYNYDYIYRSNLGAYVDSNKLIKFIEGKNKTKFYCGIVGKDSYYLGREVTFASGSGYFLSNDLVEIVLSNEHLWNHNIVDDVALGELLSKFSINVDKSAMRLNYCDNKVFYQIGDLDVDHIDKSELYHIRLRSDSREIDINRMSNLYEEIITNNENI